MQRLIRLNTPDWLQENYKKWGKQYEAKRNNPNKKNEFTWATYQKNKVNTLLLPILIEQTQNHCSYCDGYPMNSMGETIDHFRPKANYPLLAYVWHNLFLCCYNCQKRNNSFDKRLLKPDQISYNFNHYFVFKYATGFIEVNPRRELSDQEKARITIDLFQLNGFGRPEDRLENWRKYQNQINPKSKDNFPYRFIL